MPDMKIRCPECGEYDTLIYRRMESKTWPLEVMENTTGKGLKYIHKLGIRRGLPTVEQQTYCINPGCTYNVIGQPRSSEIVYPVGD